MTPMARVTRLTMPWTFCLTSALKPTSIAYTSVAPLSMQIEMGTSAQTAPSTYWKPSYSIGGSSGGAAALESTASTSDAAGSSPHKKISAVLMFEVVRYNLMSLMSPKVLKPCGRWDVTNLRRLSLVERLSAPVIKRASYEKRLPGKMS